MSCEQTETLSKAVNKGFLLVLMFFGGSSFKESVCSTVRAEDIPKGIRKVEELVRGTEIRTNEENVNLSAQLVRQKLRHTGHF